MCVASSIACDSCVRNRAPILMSTLRVEMHCHTHHSHDGVITFDGLVRIARRRSLDAICVTDHDTIEGALDFKRRAKKSDLDLQFIIGEERTLEDGRHVIGLFLKESLSSKHWPAVREEIRSQGGLVLFPHPFRKKDGFFRDAESIEQAMFEGVSAFEVFNAKGSFSMNERAKHLIGLTPAVFGGSDAHYEADVGRSICEIEQQGDIEASLRAMLSGRTPYRIIGELQRSDRKERKYAGLYNKIRPFVRLPKASLPLAKQAYRWYWNSIRHRGDPELVEIFRSPQRE